LRQTKPAKAVDQMRLDRLGSFVRARLQNLGEPRMIIEHRQWVAASLARFNVALEIDLRQIIRRRVLEAVPWLGSLARRWTDPVVPLEHLSDRARRRGPFSSVL
jgi:hypothetical protein